MPSMVDPPLALPGRTEIQVSALQPQSMSRLLIALEASPNSDTFTFTISGVLSPAEVARLLLDLRRICVRTSDTTLRFCLLDIPRAHR
jgi:hypothetical protein